MKKFKNIVVLIADGKPNAQNYSIDIKGVKIPKKKVVVTLNFDAKKPLGTAELRIEGNQVVADLELNEDGFDNLVPCTKGAVDRIGDGISLIEIGLSEKNADSRINMLSVSGVVVHEKKYSDLSFKTLRSANLNRLPEFKNSKGELAHSKRDGSDWKLSAWSNAVVGELGEAANIIKKIERGDFTLEEKREELAKEFADVITYMDILAYRAGVDLGAAVIMKFNQVSKRTGSKVRIEYDECVVEVI